MKERTRVLCTAGFLFFLQKRIPEKEKWKFGAEIGPNWIVWQRKSDGRRDLRM